MKDGRSNPLCQKLGLEHAISFIPKVVRAPYLTEEMAKSLAQISLRGQWLSSRGRRFDVEFGSRPTTGCSDFAVA